ncbi:MAG: UDP-3-O-(3-hydroxymyristoyl)glucosamine N-acyltransferase [Saprospiraceae bacterium]
MIKILIENLLNEIEYDSFRGNVNTALIGITSLDDLTEKPGLMRWSNVKNIDRIKVFSSGTFILDTKSKDDIRIKENCNYVFVESPRYFFQKSLALLYPDKNEWRISNTASIHESVSTNEKIAVGHNVVIHENCTIGKSVRILDNTVILANTIIEDGVTIGANCTIGGVGFGYEKNPAGEYELLQHIGNVYIKSKAHIGNNTCIDRAVMGSTIIGNNVKIDNLVHIAHGVIIHDNSLIIANAMVGGSVTIGKNVWVAPSSTIINKVNIGDDALIGLGAVVLKNVEKKTIVVGNPARPLNK